MAQAVANAVAESARRAAEKTPVQDVRDVREVPAVSAVGPVGEAPAGFRGRLTTARLREAIILNELLSPPLALRDEAM